MTVRSTLLSPATRPPPRDLRDIRDSHRHWAPLSGPQRSRAILAELKALDAPALALENAGRLADPDAAAIVIAAEPGLLGGPLITLVNAMSAIAGAERLALESGRPVIPVLRVGTEVPDRAGLDRIHLLSSGDEIVPVSLDLAGSGAEHVLERAGTVLPAGRYRAEVLASLAPGEEPSRDRWFQRILLSWLGGHGLVVALAARIPSAAVTSLPPARLILVERRIEKACRHLGTTVEDVIVRGEEALPRVGVRPAVFAAALLDLERAIAGGWTSVRDEAGRLDESLLEKAAEAEEGLERALARVRRHVRRGLAGAGGPAEAGRRRVLAHLRPRGSEPDRVLSPLSFLVRHGMGLIRELLDVLRAHPVGDRIVYLEESEKSR